MGGFPRGGKGDRRPYDRDRRDSRDRDRGGGKDYRDRDRDYRHQDRDRDPRGKGGKDRRDRPRDWDRDHRDRDAPRRDLNRDIHTPKPDFDLPFQLTHRSVSEHFSRHLHRTTVIPRDLQRITAHWTERPLGQLPPALTDVHSITVSTDENEFFIHNGETPAEQETTPVDETLLEEEVRALENAAPQLPAVCEVRAMLPFRCSEGPDTAKGTPHIQKAYEIIVEKNQLGGKPYLRAYGGVCPEAVLEKHTDAAATISRMTSEQCGLSIPPEQWKPLMELTYKSGRRVLFMMPAEAGSKEITVIPTCVSEVKQVEQDVNEEVEGEDGEPKTVTTKKTVEETTQRVVLQPTRVPVVNLVENKLALSNAPIELIELAFSTDALYEYLKREMASRLPAAITAHVERKRVFDEEINARRAQVDELRKAYREGNLSLKEKRQADDEALRAELRKELWGCTKDEKRDVTKERTDVIESKRRAEDKAAEAQFRKTVEEAEKPKETYRIVKETDLPSYEALQFFDKPRGPTKDQGMISKARLCGLLLCLPDAGSTKSVMTLLNQATNGTFLHIREACTIKTKVPLEETPAAPAAEEAMEVDEPQDAKDAPQDEVEAPSEPAAAKPQAD